MNITISHEQIEATQAFKKLDKVFQKMVLRLESRKTLTNGLSVYKSTGVIPSTVAGNNKRILLELIENSKN